MTLQVTPNSPMTITNTIIDTVLDVKYNRYSAEELKVIINGMKMDFDERVITNIDIREYKHEILHKKEIDFGESHSKCLLYIPTNRLGYNDNRMIISLNNDELIYDKKVLCKTISFEEQSKYIHQDLLDSGFPIDKSDDLVYYMIEDHRWINFYVETNRNYCTPFRNGILMDHYNYIPNASRLIKEINILTTSITTWNCGDNLNVTQFPPSSNNNLNILIRNMNKEIRAIRSNIVKSMYEMDISTQINKKYSCDLNHISRINGELRSELSRVVSELNRCKDNLQGLADNIRTKYLMNKSIKGIKSSINKIKITYNDFVSSIIMKNLKQNSIDFNNMNNIYEDFKVIESYINGDGYLAENITNDALYDYIVNNPVFESMTNKPTLNISDLKTEQTLMDKIIEKSSNSQFEGSDCMRVSKADLAKLCKLPSNYRFKSLPSEIASLSISKKFVKTNNISYLYFSY